MLCFIYPEAKWTIGDELSSLRLCFCFHKPPASRKQPDVPGKPDATCSPVGCLTAPDATPTGCRLLIPHLEPISTEQK